MKVLKTQLVERNIGNGIIAAENPLWEEIDFKNEIDKLNEFTKPKRK